MIGLYNSITIDGNAIYRGNNFALSREYIHAGGIETCTGKYCADLVGWRYADVTIQWDALPEAQLLNVLSLSGEQVNLTFGNEAGATVTEAVIPTVISSTASRSTDNAGRAMWTGIQLQLKFITAHNPET